jgi:hypothetical protein
MFGPLEASIGEVSSPEVGVGEICPEEVDASQIHILKVGRR